MKNIVITIILFCSLILVCFVSVHYLNKTSYKMHFYNTSIENYINSDKWNEAYKLSENFSKDWDKHCDYFSLFVNHTLIDDISTEEAKLQQYVKYKNKDEALASSYTIQFLIDRITKLEKISTQNIF